MGEDPHVPPGGRVLHAKNAIAFFAKHTRLLHSKNFAFAASKRTAKTWGISTGRKSNPVGEGLHSLANDLLSLQRETDF